MVSGTILATGAIIALAGRVSAHACMWHPSMWGFNVTSGIRPQDPLINLPFSEWWFHGHLSSPPHPEDIMQLPVGGAADFEISCDKDATSYWPSGPGGDQRDHNNPNYPCPGWGTQEFHTNGINDLGGCALGVAYKSDVSQVQPEDFTIFSVNQTCVWYMHTSFSIPEQMPQCPDGKCTCAWFWIHKADSGSEQMYMTGFQCNMQGAMSTTPLPPAQVARRCGDDPDLGHPPNPSNCTYGPKQPLYWYQAERNNMFEGTYTPPLYNDLYHFLDGAQTDIFQPGNSSAQPNAGTPSSSLPSSSSSPPAPPPAPQTTPASTSTTMPSSPSPPPQKEPTLPPPPAPSHTQKPEQKEPKKPAQKEPKKPAQKEPKKPAQKEPKKPAQKEPKKPEQKEPKKPAQKEPKKPEQKEPKKPAQKEPKKPEQKEPKEPTRKEPKKPAQKEPKKPAQKEPKKPAHKQEHKPEHKGEHKHDSVHKPEQHRPKPSNVFHSLETPSTHHAPRAHRVVHQHESEHKHEHRPRPRPSNVFHAPSKHHRVGGHRRRVHA